MKVEMNDAGGIDILDLSIDQVIGILEAIKASPVQYFMDDPQLQNMIKLLSILQSEALPDRVSGNIDFSQFTKKIKSVD